MTLQVGDRVRLTRRYVREATEDQTRKEFEGMVGILDETGPGYVQVCWQVYETELYYSYDLADLESAASGLDLMLDLL